MEQMLCKFYSPVFACDHYIKIFAVKVLRALMFYFRASVFVLGDTRHRTIIIIKTLTRSLCFYGSGKRIYPLRQITCFSNLMSCIY